VVINFFLLQQWQYSFRSSIAEQEPENEMHDDEAPASALVQITAILMYTVQYNKHKYAKHKFTC
jgi:hypothetical protein